MAAAQSILRSRCFGVVAFVVVVSLLAGGCSTGSNADRVAATSETVTSHGAVEFCDAIEAAFRTEDTDDVDDAFDAAMDLAPDELSAATEGIRAANQIDPGEDLTEQTMADVGEFWSWVSYNCNPTGEPVRHIAPPAVPIGFVGCGTMPASAVEEAEGSMVVYGDASLEDPFGGTMVSVVTGRLIGP